MSTRSSSQAGAGAPLRSRRAFQRGGRLLYGYDAIVVANLESDFFTRAQLSMMADFVSERGGGLLGDGRPIVHAARPCRARRSRDVLPVEMNDRRGGLVHGISTPDDPARPGTCTQGDAHG